MDSLLRALRLDLTVALEMESYDGIVVAKGRTSKSGMNNMYGRFCKENQLRFAVAG